MDAHAAAHLFPHCAQHTYKPDWFPTWYWDLGRWNNILSHAVFQQQQQHIIIEEFMLTRKQLQNQIKMGGSSTGGDPHGVAPHGVAILTLLPIFRLPKFGHVRGPTARGPRVGQTPRRRTRIPLGEGGRRKRKGAEELGK